MTILAGSQVSERCPLRYLFLIFCSVSVSPLVKCLAFLLFKTVNSFILPSDVVKLHLTLENDIMLSEKTDLVLNLICSV